MLDYKDYFKGKKITIVGLGLLGRGVGDAQFLAECGADLIVTDLKSAEDLAPSLKKLKKYKNITYRLGEHNLGDFKNRDMIVKSAGVPLDSPYIAEAKKNKIPVEMDASLFAKFAPKRVVIVGVTGTRGKSTVTHLIYEMLIEAKIPAYLGGNVRGLATLPLIKKVREGDVIIMELDSWQLQGFGEAEISPQISVFTNFLPDHLNYYKGDMTRYFMDKASIYRFAKATDLFITTKQLLKEITRHSTPKPHSKVITIKATDIPQSWKVRLLGEHNRTNLALAVQVAQKLGVNPVQIKKVAEHFSGIPGRLEHVDTIKGVYYYNDTTATTPDGAIAAMKSFDTAKGKLILIAGGKDKELNYKNFAREAKKRVAILILLLGEGTTATDKIIKELGKTKLRIIFVFKMAEAVAEAMRVAKRGDNVILSPASASFGMFKNEFDRGDQFNKAVAKLQS